MDPQSPAWEELLDAVRDLAGGPIFPLQADLVGRLGVDAGSAALGITAVGRQVGRSALDTQQATDRFRALFEAGCISADALRRELGFDDEEDDVAGRRGLAGRRRRRSDRAEIPPQAQPIAGYLRIHRDEADRSTSIYHRDGTLLRSFTDEEDGRPIGQILTEDYVPLICSGCGEILGTPLCDECRQDIVNDLVRGLDHE